jgi:arginyl-tRNA synthetase
MMDKNGKPFKTRDGGTVKLIDLLDEAVIKAKDGINNKDEYNEIELEEIAKIVGIGAVKYADLSISRESNYIFDWDKMLSLNGNTALYIQYAYARIESIFKKHNQEIKGKIVISNSDEHQLTLALLQFEDVLIRTAKEGYPHYLTNYLYNIATIFMRFYESSPVLKDDVDEETKMSRLIICQLVSKTIKQGLDILAIKVVNKI